MPCVLGRFRSGKELAERGSGRAEAGDRPGSECRGEDHPAASGGRDQVAERRAWRYLVVQSGQSAAVNGHAGSGPGGSQSGENATQVMPRDWPQHTQRTSVPMSTCWALMRGQPFSQSRCLFCS